jgi:hypothetical protein
MRSGQLLRGLSLPYRRGCVLLMGLNYKKQLLYSSGDFKYLLDFMGADIKKPTVKSAFQ